jgi:F5/8 type C domain/Abnormal spindle-like microcephaly-assoc'd, ASPM-SPD-2-Hydin
VNNTESTAVSVSQIAASGDFAETSTCGASIAAGASCTVSVTFTPTAAGTQTGSLTIASNATNSLNTVSLTGTGAGPVNLALNQPATASGYTQTYVPANAVDGNTSTYWESTDNDFPQWLQVDLGSTQSFSSIVLDLPPSTAWSTRTQTLSILGSNDDSTFTTIVASAGYTFNPSTGNTVTITFPSVSYRYVQLDFTANTGWPAGQVSEFQVWSS